MEIHTQTYNIKGKMQSSMDAALLSATLEAQKLPSDATPEERQDVLEEAFEDFYSANFSNLMYKDDSFVLSSDDYTITFNEDTNQVSAQVDFDHNGPASKLTSMYQPVIAASSTTALEVVEDHYIIDIVMCIDATGSMQNTLDAVKVAAQTFNDDLRGELSITDENLKIRVRPIFYRDWDDEYYYVNDHLVPPGWSNYWWNTWYIDYYLGGRQNYEGGMVHYPVGDGFIDLDPSDESGINPTTQTANFTNFIGSERAAGGFNWPEGAGACLNDGIRSNWFDNQSQESKDYFDIPDSHTIININEPKPEGDYARVTTIPVIVFWTDANMIDQNLKLLIHFGPGTGQGWNNVKLWDRYKYGGSLNVGNSDGVERIAEEISDAVPDILRVAG